MSSIEQRKAWRALATQTKRDWPERGLPCIPQILTLASAIVALVGELESRDKDYWEVYGNMYESNERETALEAKLASRETALCNVRGRLINVIALIDTELGE